MFNVNVHCCQTKSFSIVNKFLYPHYFQTFLSELKDVSCVSIAFDISNFLRNVKLMPITYVEIESDISDSIIDTLQQCNIKKKIMSISADNTNGNFGGNKPDRTKQCFA
ncbi:hypothetical protein A3Q56_08235 [Intoshia linei]|uniref:Uncharacterized protein n=1 Tax=Intoshia linei TaxID=1819745 RepID=A0A177APX1_9BILA|nr:hypothetical protein A3Q56_08235 [Intoshia linei]